jgi:hypothetical protein
MPNVPKVSAFIRSVGATDSPFAISSKPEVSIEQILQLIKFSSLVVRLSSQHPNI